MSYISVTLFKEEIKEFIDMVDVAKQNGFEFKSEYGLNSLYERIHSQHIRNQKEESVELILKAKQDSCKHSIEFKPDGITAFGGSNECTKCGYIDSIESGR